MNRIVKIINEQQDLIKNNFVKFRQDMLSRNENFNQFKILKEIFNLNLNLDLIENYIRNLFEAVQFSKSRIISADILSTEEITEASKLLRNEHVITETFDEVLEYLEIIVIHKHPKIIFTVLVPRLAEGKFEHHLLEPIIKDGKVLNLHAKEVLNNNHGTYLITGQCYKVGQTVVCNENEVKDVSKDSCYPKILRGVSSSCDFFEVTSSEQIKRITDNYIIVNSNQSTLITSNCGLTDRNISGTMLIFFRNCSVTINDQSFTETEYTKKQPALLIPLNGLDIKSKSIHANVTLQKLEEINLQTRNQLLALHRNHLILSFGSSTAIISIVILLTVYLLRSHWKCHLRRKPNNVPGRSVLQEGAVNEKIDTTLEKPSSLPGPAPRSSISTFTPRAVPTNNISTKPVKVASGGNSLPIATWK